MTEFRRASGAVEALEALVAAIASDAGAGAGAPSDEARANFVEARSKARELQPTADKMRRKCEARAELDALRARLVEVLPAGTAEDAAVRTAQEAVDAGADAAASLKPLLEQALELEGLATYGAKMVEKVRELLGRFDAASARLEGELAPRLEDAVEAARAADDARRASEAEARAAAEAAERQRAAEEERRAVLSLMAENEERLKAKRAREEEDARQKAAEEEARQKAAAELQAEEEALQRAEQEGEARLAAVGPDAACAEALAAMLAVPVGVYRRAVSALHELLAAVAAEPQDVRLRVVRVANEGFHESLGRRPGARLFLRGVGFQPRSRESLPSGLIAALGLGSGPPAERFFYLQEPNMMEAYEEWNLWYERIKAIAGFLHGLERLVFQRTAHLGQHGLDAATRTVLSAEEVVQRWPLTG